MYTEHVTIDNMPAVIVYSIDSNRQYWRPILRQMNSPPFFRSSRTLLPYKAAIFLSAAVILHPKQKKKKKKKKINEIDIFWMARILVFPKESIGLLYASGDTAID
jgi:hypothetical protein